MRSLEIERSSLIHGSWSIVQTIQRQPPPLSVKNPAATSASGHSPPASIHHDFPSRAHRPYPLAHSWLPCNDASTPSARHFDRSNAAIHALFPPGFSPWKFSSRLRSRLFHRFQPASIIRTQTTGNALGVRRKSGTTGRQNTRKVARTPASPAPFFATSNQVFSTAPGHRPRAIPHPRTACCHSTGRT